MRYEGKRVAHRIDDWGTRRRSLRPSESNPAVSVFSVSSVVPIWSWIADLEYALCRGALGFLDGHAVQGAGMGGIGQRRRMQYRCVVPHDDVAHAVLHPVLVFWLGRVGSQFPQQRQTFFFVHSLDSIRGAGNCIQRLAAAVRMTAYQGMADQVRAALCFLLLGRPESRGTRLGVEI